MIKKFSAVFAFFSLCFFNFSSAQVGVNNLRCEQLENPRGIEVQSPGLGWQIQSDQRNVQQTAYQVLVATSREKLNEHEADLWNSGRVTSNHSQHNKYAGVELESRMDCYWKVRVWTNKGESDWSEPASWSMGLLYYNDWSARWIGFDRAFPWDDDSFHSRLSSRYFRKEFEVKKEVKRARVHIIGLGLYELSLNGEKIGDAVLAPAPTDYYKNIKYNVYDLTEQLNDGVNALGVVLGNGRFYTMRQHYKGYKIKNFGFPKMLFQLEVEYADGTTERIKSDNSWRGTADGPIRSNNEYDGEIYDARKTFDGWDEPGFDAEDWLIPEYVSQPDGVYEAQLNSPMKVLMEVKPVSITAQGVGKYILDMGQNMVGWLNLQVEGQQGDTVRMRFGEILQEDGELFTANLRDAQATATYVLKGEGAERWEPQFTYYGFRYVEITGYPGTPTLDDFVGKVVSDDMALNGTFNTSNKLINQIYQNAYWGILGNYKGMPIDCPQRNERQPWMGDRPIMSFGENFIFDNAALYNKWLDDIAYAQKADGAISDVSPAYWRYYSDNMTWSGTFLVIADMLYHQTGASYPIKKHYPAMKKWLAYMETRYLKDGIMTKDSYGDWCEPPVSIEAGRGKNANRKYPSALISTAYYCYYLNLMQKFATISGHEDDIDDLKVREKQALLAFNREFYKPDQKGYGSNKLTENLLALGMNLVPEDRKEELIHTIVRTIEDTNEGHLSTGVVGTQWLMRTLTHNGHADLAWQLATNTTYPSWGYMVEQGATTIWELWNGNTAAPKMNSYNHVMMLGDLISWYYEDLAGIESSAQEPGFKKIIMQPQFIDELDFVEASYRSPYGLIESSWKVKGRQLSWEITIPANSSAIVAIPGEKLEAVNESGKPLHGAVEIQLLEQKDGKLLLEIGSGNYHFETKMPK